jgi:hypothetical protein
MIPVHGIALRTRLNERKDKMADKPKQTRADGQLTGMAGEFLVAGKLFKRQMQVSVTMGNAKAIDLFAHNPKTERTFNIQVKTLRKKNCFPMQRENIKTQDVYVFVLLNSPDQAEQFFIVPGATIKRNIDRFFGSSYKKEKPSNVPAVNCGALKEFENNWELFDK